MTEAELQIVNEPLTDDELIALVNEGEAGVGAVLEAYEEAAAQHAAFQSLETRTVIVTSR